MFRSCSSRCIQSTACSTHEAHMQSSMHITQALHALPCILPSARSFCMRPHCPRDPLTLVLPVPVQGASSSTLSKPPITCTPTHHHLHTHTSSPAHPNIITAHAHIICTYPHHHLHPPPMSWILNLVPSPPHQSMLLHITLYCVLHGPQWHFPEQCRPCHPCHP